MVNFKANIVTILDLDYNKTINTATKYELYNAISKAAMKVINNKNSEVQEGRKVAYFSAEFLIGRLFYNNLVNLGLINQYSEIMSESGLDTRMFEDVEDTAIGNGGLGRLAACFLDSAATHNIGLDGYGIRYQYGYFKQYFEDGFQKEKADDWQKHGDPWSVRREDEKVEIVYKGQSVYAVPYDTPIVGYNSKRINNLRLWQAEAKEPFDFELFNEQKYDKAVKEKNDAEAITKVLYPSDDTDVGKQMRLKQQYLFTSASLQDMIRRYKKKYGDDFSKFADVYAIQLNDTHPVVAIPEFIRIMVEDEGITFTKALKMAKEVFAYTNHTVMAEALEKWNVALFKGIIPNVYKYIVLINKALLKELELFGIDETDKGRYVIIDDNKSTIHMARMAVFATHSTNGVAGIHTEILKNDVLKDWYKLYPARFNNKTNGITQRRWLLIANPELAGYVTDKIGNSWTIDLNKIKNIEDFKDDNSIIDDFNDIKQIKKRQLADYIMLKDGIKINPDFIFDIQVKRIHEYKRQLLNAFSILDIYYGLKNGRIDRNLFNPTVFIFGGKAAPGYVRAKGIIKYINEISKMIENDNEVKDMLQVVFVSDYCVSYAEKIMPAADVSVQISTAGTEASGTGNMKFMLNGAVTLGTYDGANIEIVEQAGRENSYIFGATVSDIESIKDSYVAKDIYMREPRIRKVMDTLVDGIFNDGGTGIFKELFDSILYGAEWHKPDNYFLLLDFIPLCEERLKLNADYSDRMLFRRKCFMNMANAGNFSSDRTVKEYANEIWKAL
ncbi:MAG: glycogen/starch/alpha-glucan family phosphorylase [Lachnospiraceae bacterium]|nr:glycogen/starch/alpha-glucan family phosphorylase [Lachnospiraceae bacterium]